MKKYTCTEEEWLALHQKYMSAPEEERWNALTREETYLYYNLKNRPKEYQINEKEYKIVK